MPHSISPSPAFSALVSRFENAAVESSEPRQLPELKAVANQGLVLSALVQHRDVEALEKKLLSAAPGDNAVIRCLWPTSSARLEVVTQTLRDHAPEPLADMPLALRMEESVGSLLLRVSNPELFATAYRGVLETVLVQKVADRQLGFIRVLRASDGQVDRMKEGFAGWVATIEPLSSGERTPVLEQLCRPLEAVKGLLADDLEPALQDRDARAVSLFRFANLVYQTQRVDPDVIQQFAQLMQLSVTPRPVVDAVHSVPAR